MKPAKVIELEKKTHKTKQELAERRRREEATLSGQKLIESKEVKENLEAHKEFLVLSRLLDAVEKNDALYSEVINRYCLLKAECKAMAERREMLIRQTEELALIKAGMDPTDYFTQQRELDKAILSYERLVQQKRNMMFAIEKENIMTIAAALRSVPKQTEKKTNPLLEALGS